MFHKENNLNLLWLPSAQLWQVICHMLNCRCYLEFCSLTIPMSRTQLKSTSSKLKTHNSEKHFKCKPSHIFICTTQWSHLHAYLSLLSVLSCTKCTCVFIYGRPSHSSIMQLEGTILSLVASNYDATGKDHFLGLCVVPCNIIPHCIDASELGRSSMMLNIPLFHITTSGVFLELVTRHQRSDEVASQLYTTFIKKLKANLWRYLWYILLSYLFWNISNSNFHHHSRSSC